MRSSSPFSDGSRNTNPIDEQAAPYHDVDLQSQQATEPPLGSRVSTAYLPLIYPSWRTLTRWLLVVVALYVIGWLLWAAAPALTPFIIGLILAYLLLPIVNWLAKPMPRWLAILTVYVSGIILIAAAIAYVVPPVSSQIQQLIDNFPSLARLQELESAFMRQYERNVPDSIRAPLNDAVGNVLQSARTNLTTYAQRVGQFLLNQVLQVISLVSFLIGFLIIPIWLFFVLNDAAKGRAFIDRILHPRIRADFWNVVGMINQVFSDYIRGQLTLGLTIGAMVGVGLLILNLFGFGIDYILLLAIIAGITELIPIIGPVLGAIPGVLIAFFSGGLSAGLVVVALYVIVQQLENNFLVPRIIGESIGVHPAILTVVLIAMGQVFGLVGVILAAPITAVARDLFVYTYRRLEGISAPEARRVISKSAKREATQPG